MATPTTRFAAVLLPAVALAFGGCAGGDCTLAGKVTYQGKPVVYGTVIAQGSDGIRRTGNIGLDGSYSVEKLPPGAVKLTVESPQPPDQDTLNQAPTGGPAGAPRNRKAIDRSKWMALPDKYADADQSGLSTTLKVGANPFDIEMP